MIKPSQLIPFVLIFHTPYPTSSLRHHILRTSVPISYKYLQQCFYFIYPYKTLTIRVLSLKIVIKAGCLNTVDLLVERIG